MSDQDAITFICPHCQKQLRAKRRAIGRTLPCPNPACGEAVTVPDSTTQPDHAAPVPKESATAADWQELLAYLRDRRPAEISTVTKGEAAAVVTRHYEAVAADPTCPALTYYLLKASPAATETNPYLLVAVGGQSEHDKAWNFNYEAIRNRVLPGKTWDDFAWGGGYSNHSKPGMRLASTAGFDRLAGAISRGDYQIERVFRPGFRAQPGPDEPKPPRWNVQVFGEEAVYPGLACQVCGANRVALGNYGSLLVCRRCGEIYCRRNCQASIHGQCPRCGEADKIDFVSEPPTAKSATATSRQSPTGCGVTKPLILVGDPKTGLESLAQRLRDDGISVGGINETDDDLPVLFCVPLDDGPMPATQRAVQACAAHSPIPLAILGLKAKLVDDPDLSELVILEMREYLPKWAPSLFATIAVEDLPDFRDNDESLSNKLRSLLAGTHVGSAHSPASQAQPATGKTASPPARASRAPTGPIDVGTLVVELTQLVGADNSGFRNKGGFARSAKT